MGFDQPGFSHPGLQPECTHASCLVGNAHRRSEERHLDRFCLDPRSRTDRYANSAFDQDSHTSGYDTYGYSRHLGRRTVVDLSGTRRRQSEGL